jgi:putative ABC transport system permease protein
MTNERGKTELKVKGRSDEEIKHTAPLAGADVSSDYFATMGIPLKEGRLFDSRDTTHSPMVLIASERAAKALWPDRSPIGQQLLWGALSSENPYCTIVGVVGNIKHRSAEADDGFELYYPYTQYPVTNVYYVIRTHGNSLGVAKAVRGAINETDRQAAVVFMKPMTQLISETLWQRRLWGVMFTMFAALALILAAVGIYGVLSYSVSQRTRELGIRLALGAQSRDVLRLVILQGMKLTALGIVLGLAISFVLVRLISSLLFGITAYDPATFSLMSVVLIGVSLMACYIPARRAVGVDPLIALRIE